MGIERVRPAFVIEKHLEYLDDLRESGIVNMFGASKYLQGDFGMDRKAAMDTLVYWMETFSERHARNE